jgi:hypothetical protein
MHGKFQSEILKERDHLRNLGVDGRVSRIKEAGWAYVKWIELAFERV